MKNYNTEPNVDGQVSEWNEAMFKMIRLHKLQTEINISFMNPFDKNETGEYNYKVAFNLLCRLYGEGKAKYKATEIVEVDTIKDILENLMYKFPVHCSRINSSYDGDKRIDTFNNGNWKLIKQFLDMFETKVKYYNDVHGLSTKNAENMSGGSIMR